MLGASDQEGDRAVRAWLRACGNGLSGFLAPLSRISLPVSARQTGTTIVPAKRGHTLGKGYTMQRWRWSLAILGLAVSFLPVRSHAAPMPGSVPGQALNFTVSEPFEPVGQEAPSEPPLNFNFNVGAGNFVESGSLLLCEPGTECDPADTLHLNWSDVIQWAGGRYDPNNGDCTGTLYSDPTTFPDLSQPVGQGTIVMAEVLNPDGSDGVEYQASDGAAAPSITTWTIRSDVVPEPGSFGLLGFGLVGLATLGRRGQR